MIFPRKKPELLSPAGDPEKLRFAVDYGADAVYCALKRFGMRSASENFTPEELEAGIAYAHEKGRRVYLTVNVLPRERELSELAAALDALDGIRPDAFIVSDPGVLELLKKRIRDPVLHLSTQASTVNSAACRFWQKQGVKRIVLARELTLEEIRSIRQNVPDELELEAFVHGAMCIAYSGRCLLSDYFTGRGSNEGKCAQPCRWRYFLREAFRPDDILTVEQTEEGTSLFSSKDLRMIEHLGEIADAGIDCFKIEGRVKSAYYAAAVTNAYRLALDACFAGKPFDPALLAETESVSHREYGTGFFFSPPSEQANVVSENRYLKDRAFLAVVRSYDVVTRLAGCVQYNKMATGERVNLLSPGTTGTDFTVGELFDASLNPIPDTRHPRMKFYLRMSGGVEPKKGDLIRGRE